MSNGPVYVPSPAPGLGYGGADYGYSPYGSGSFPRQPWPVSGGYGGAPYGLASYGSVDIEPPRVSSALSLDGYRIEVFFSEEMEIEALLLDTVSYAVIPVIGAPCTVLAVEVGVEGVRGGATSVILTHTGTTLGGQYQVSVVAPVRDMSGNTLLPTAASAILLTLGETPTFTATPTSGTELLLEFSEDLLPETEFSPGTESLASYEIATDYPVMLTLTEATHPVEGDYDKVALTVAGMTSATYDLTVSPSDVVQYDGTYLPDEASTFLGLEVGTGAATAGVTGLLLSKPAGGQYGWAFEDTSGRMLPSSSYRVDVTVDASSAVYIPPLFDTTLATLTINDGAVEAVIVLTRIAGLEVIELISGTHVVQVPFMWSAHERTITLLRNQKADHYALLLDGVPVSAAPTASFNGAPTINPGVQFTLGPSYEVVQFPLRSVGVTSTQTVFSQSWNFLHGVSYTFVGSTASARPHILTRRGPLVKGWGDPTPATNQDVEVRVNGVVVSVAEVNPYIGSITPSIPIPLTPPGTTTVEVDYIWFPNPPMAMTGLNTLGLVLNKWDLHQGHNPPAVSPLPPNHPGVPDRNRFPMGVVLGPLRKTQPVQIGHRYIGFEKAYSSTLNSPTTLLLGQNPHALAKASLSASPPPVNVSYGGTVLPEEATHPWDLYGVDAGHVGEGDDDGFYILVDATSGAYGEGQPTLYHRAEDLSFPSAAVFATRLQVVSYDPDGVFTGIGFGLHDNRYLYLVGLVVINGVRHVGVLLDATQPYSADSWKVGPAFPITITSSTTFLTDSSAFAVATATGRSLTFQVFDGPQAGVYLLADCGVRETDGLYQVTVDSSTPFPADPNVWGNQEAEAVLEIPWDEYPITFRGAAEVSSGAFEVFVGGLFSDEVISVNPVPTFPAATTLLLPTEGKGQVFWGSVSRKARNTSRWAYFRYGIQPNLVTFHFKGIVVATDMTVPPDEAAPHLWFITEDFGHAAVESGTLLLSSATASPTEELDTTFGYARLEPFLTTRTTTDFDATFRVDTGVLGAGDAQVVLLDGNREVRLGTILFVEGGIPFRRLVRLPDVVGITCLRDPRLEGWVEDATTPFGLNLAPREQTLAVEQTSGTGGLLYASIGHTPDSTGDRLLEARFAVLAYSLGSGSRTGPFIAVQAGTAPSGRQVGLTLGWDAGPEIVLTSDGVDTAGVFPFDWTDGLPHSYRLLVDVAADTVSLVVDDNVLGTVPFSSFEAISEDTRVYLGASTSDATFLTEWWALSASVLPGPGVRRTLGIFRGVDPDDIDSWELPRTDTSTEHNSNAAAFIEEMDWRSDVNIRLRLDPAWGATLFRPDLPLPPYFDGDYASPMTQPSAGWINVEYRGLPRAPVTFGRVVFGALDRRSVTLQRWVDVRYHIYTLRDGDFLAHQNMVLNRYNVITSGEFNRDVTVEVVEVEALSATVVSLAPAHIYADRVFNVVVGTTVLGPTDWSFDKDSQAVLLAAPLPTPHELVTVAFAPGKPVTTTYLATQPLEASVTLLNEGTPPVPKSQVGPANRTFSAGGVVVDPVSEEGVIDHTGFDSVTFTDDPALLYEKLDFIEVSDEGDTGLLSSVCDGPAPEEGWIEIALEGTMFSDGFSQAGGPATGWGGASVRDFTSPVHPMNVLRASGGHPLSGGLLNESVLNSHGPSPSGRPTGTVSPGMSLYLRLNSVWTAPGVETLLIDDLDVQELLGDNEAPSGASGAFDNGAADMVMIDASSTTYSRVGPWAGEAALAVRSQLAGGGLPASGMAFTLEGGAPLGPGPTVTTFTVEAAG